MSTAELGGGIFLVKDVADILGLKLSKVRRWLKEFWDNRFATQFGKYSWGDDDNLAVNFYTLIEFIAFAKLREHGISAQRIQKFHCKLATQLNTPYPFAKTKLLTDKKDVWFEYYNEVVKLDGKNQIALKKILLPYLHKIEYDEVNSIALRYYPLGKTHKVVIDPDHQFGQPTIVGTNIKATVIFSLYKGKESRQNICHLYNLSKKQVDDAISYCKKIAA
ncbi:MAG: DUF433 domain-containing protein [Bacteroidota bacterium]